MLPLRKTEPDFALGFVSNTRKLVDITQVDNVNVWVFSEVITNELGIEEKRPVYLIERVDWDRAEYWNWRELGRFKRIPGLIVSEALFHFLTHKHPNPHHARFAIYFKKDNTFHWTSIHDLIDFHRKIGMGFFDERRNERVIGLSKQIFSGVPRT